MRRRAESSIINGFARDPRNRHGALTPDITRGGNSGCPSGYPRQPGRNYYRKMSSLDPARENSHAQPVPRLLVELPSRPRVFFGNLRALMLPSGLDRLRLQSAPGTFWPDVFVARRLPWRGLVHSTAYHGTALVLLVAFTHLFSLEPRVVPAARFDHSDVVYYQASDLLPTLDTRRESTPAAETKPDPELSRQPIISVPAEADNRSQTIVTPPKVKLKSEVALPNIVRSDEKKPRLAIPEAPLTTAAEIMRMAPKLDQPVVRPAPDAAQLRDRRNDFAWQSAVVAPPPELNDRNVKNGYAGFEPQMIAPPPTIEVRSMRPTGQMNVAPSAVIAPAPELPLAAQRSLAAGRPRGGPIEAQVVPPPPSVSGARSTDGSLGSRGRVVALNLHPAIAAPPDPPAGNRRGTFSATPEGHAGASGAPGSRSIADGNGNDGKSPVNSNLPSGLYVGKTAEKSSPADGISTGQPTNSVNPKLLANARPPRLNSGPARSAASTQLSEPERKVFDGKKFYSLTLNMPNLNSAGGSWVVHFAEAKPESSPRAPNAPAADLSQPMATRTVDPAYPLELMRENVAGTVILYALIRADGSVGNVSVLRGVDERLNRFALEAVSQWRFQPARKNGVPVDVEATFQIPFRPRGGTQF